MLDTHSPAASSRAAVQPVAADLVQATLSAGLPPRPSCLLLAMRQIESKLGMLLVTFHDDAGFWRAFARLIQHLGEDLSVAERARLRSHADCLLVRAGMSSWTLIGAANDATVCVVRAWAR